MLEKHTGVRRVNRMFQYWHSWTKFVFGDKMLHFTKMLFPGFIAL